VHWNTPISVVSGPSAWTIGSPVGVAHQLHDTGQRGNMGRIKHGTHLFGRL
jgi:hypothetical protein